MCNLKCNMGVYVLEVPAWGYRTRLARVTGR